MLIEPLFRALDTYTFINQAQSLQCESLLQCANELSWESLRQKGPSSLAAVSGIVLILQDVH